MLSKHKLLWNVELETRKASHKTMYLKAEKCSFRQQPYCAGHWSWKVLHVLIEDQLKVDVVEAAQ